MLLAFNCDFNCGRVEPGHPPISRFNMAANFAEKILILRNALDITLPPSQVAGVIREANFRMGICNAQGDFPQQVDHLMGMLGLSEQKPCTSRACGNSIGSSLHLSQSMPAPTTKPMANGDIEVVYPAQIDHLVFEVREALRAKSHGCISDSRVLKQTFDSLDRTGSGNLGFDEFCKALEYFGVNTERNGSYKNKGDLPMHIARKLFDSFDADGDGRVSLDEVRQQCCAHSLILHRCLLLPRLR